MRRTMLTIAVTALFAGFPVAASHAADESKSGAKDPATATGDAPGVVAQCNTCHGEGGISRTRHIPHLAGQRMQYLIAEMEAYKDGQRENAPMHTVVKVLDEQEMWKVAAYYSQHGAHMDDAQANEKIESPVKLSPSAQETVDKCNRCHEDSGFADPGRFPILTGQRQEYLVEAMSSYKHRVRRESSMMHAMAFSLSPEEINVIAEYYSKRITKERVGGPPEK